MRILAALGNPGTRFQATRHNVGWMALDVVYAEHGQGAPWTRTALGEEVVVRVGAQDVLLLKPTTYMNDSGLAVVDAATRHGVERHDVTAIHDDLDLRPGQVKAKVGGSPGGHNGLKSLDACIGAGYARVRIGIGHPRRLGIPVIPYVLGDFSGHETDRIGEACAAVAAEIEEVVSGRIEAFAAKVGLRLATSKTSDPSPNRDPDVGARLLARWKEVADSDLSVETVLAPFLLRLRTPQVEADVHSCAASEDVAIMLAELDLWGADLIRPRRPRTQAMLDAYLTVRVGLEDAGPAIAALSHDVLIEAADPALSEHRKRSLDDAVADLVGWADAPAVEVEPEPDTPTPIPGRGYPVA